MTTSIITQIEKRPLELSEVGRGLPGCMWEAQTIRGGHAPAHIRCIDYVPLLVN